MSFRKKDTKYNKTIMVKRAIEVDDSLRQWIFKNSNYRRKVWNDFVNVSRLHKEHGTKFDVMKYHTQYFNEVEKPNNVYDIHTTGISEQVMKDIKYAQKLCKRNHGKLQFKKFDPFKCSFTVHCKPYYRTLAILPPRFHSRTFIVPEYDSDIIEFGDCGDHKMYFKLKEPIIHGADEENGLFYFIDRNYYYAFTQEDIKTITFIHELGKFYICLGINVINTYHKKNKESKKRKEAAGIDLGIHNPVCIYDESGCYNEKMSKRELNRIYYLERQAQRRQSIMDRKQYGSKNYRKIQRKFRVSWYKIRNIRRNWRKNLVKKIATSYNKICVDTFNIPTMADHDIKLPKKVIKRINAHNRRYAMFLFIEDLKYACWKYKTEYFESPNFTSCTCNKCGCRHAHLPLSNRIFKCDWCGETLDRDENAAKNCYNFIAC